MNMVEGVKQALLQASGLFRACEQSDSGLRYDGKANESGEHEQEMRYIIYCISIAYCE